MKKKNIIPYVALCGLLLFNPLKARAGTKYAKEPKFSAYLTYNNSELNPKEYNKEIKRISLGNVYGSVDGAGIGIEKKIGILWLNGEISRNSQKVDSIAEDINGNKFVYGYNKLGLIYGDVLLKYRIPITKSTSLDIGTGVASTLIQIETSNGKKTEKSNTLTLGPKLSVSLSQRIKNLFLRGTVAMRNSKADNLNASCLEKSVDIGLKFK